MKKALITFKVEHETKQKFDEQVKQNGKTPSQWLRSVVEQYVKRQSKKVPQKGAS